MRRDSRGKFVKSDDEKNDDAGIASDIKSLLRVLYMSWRLFPLLIVVLLLWRYLDITGKVTKVTLELLCGVNCTCSCNTPPQGKSY